MIYHKKQGNKDLMKNDAKEKEENIKQTFLKGIKELDNKEKDMHDGWDFVELVNQFICAFDNEYQLINITKHILEVLKNHFVIL